VTTFREGLEVSRGKQRVQNVHLSGACELACAPCDCRDGPAQEAWTEAIQGGGARLVIRGATGDRAALLAVVGRAREAGWAEVAVRTNGLAWSTPEAATALIQGGVDTAIVPLFSQIPAVHDRIAGRPDALVRALLALRALAAAGLKLEIETPLLPARLQQAAAVVDLAHRAVPALKAARFFVPARPLPRSLGPPVWSEGAARLADALARCGDLGVSATLRRDDAVPFCVIHHRPDLEPAFRFNPKAKVPPANNASRPPPCTDCACRDQCPGIAASYLQAHGTAGIVPLRERPRGLYEQTTTPRRRWTEKEKRAAANISMLVLRPTVNCNQDCPFCSANETSNNVWTSPDVMLREIARAARRRVERVSFSGGEPTLDKNLAAYIRAARRLGIDKVEIVTNGTLLDRAPKVRALVEAGLTHAFVSLHAHDEILSRTLTQKVGDFARTVAATDLLRKAGVATVVNHVITTRNYRYIPRFVAFVKERFEGEVGINFAFVTPQYKALENRDLLPRMSEVLPFLKAGLMQAIEIGQPSWVGSRQGIPPCQLGALQAWSDILSIANEAVSEDAPQKQRTADCDRCRYTRVCTGLWRPYVEMYGTGEIRPIEGPPLDRATIEAFELSRSPVWGLPSGGFASIPEGLRDRADEARLLAGEAEALAEAPGDDVLPAFAPVRSRPLRLVMFGSGVRARRIARAFGEVRGVVLDAVVSPHAPDADLGDFGGCPGWRDPMEALDAVRPDAAIVAAATRAHGDLVRHCLEAGIPVLCEKPLTGSAEASEALIALSEETGTLLVPAHNVLHAAGLDALWTEGPIDAIRFVRRCPSHAPDAPKAWSREGLFQTLYHALVLVGRAAGGGRVRVRDTVHGGDSAPQFLRIVLEIGERTAELRFDFDAGEDETILSGKTGAGQTTRWWRTGREVGLEVGAERREVPRGGGELTCMVAAFRDAVLGTTPPAASAGEALDAQRAAKAVIEALATAGAPFDRVGAPRHVASPALRS
jgi:MoaA/NifB/PqqE/SkfB family radical SAM enzyme/predicted dehydrogenase